MNWPPPWRTNTRRLNEAFKHCAGATVFDYLRELRLSEARRLAGKRTAVQQIASHCGWQQSGQFFYRLFVSALV